MIGVIQVRRLAAWAQTFFSARSRQVAARSGDLRWRRSWQPAAILLITAFSVPSFCQSLLCAEIASSFLKYFPYHLSQNQVMKKNVTDLDWVRGMIHATLLSLDPQQTLLTQTELERLLPDTREKAQTFLGSLGLLGALSPQGMNSKKQGPTANRPSARVTPPDCRALDPIYRLVLKASARSAEWFPTLESILPDSDQGREGPPPAAPQKTWPTNTTELKIKLRHVLYTMAGQDRLTPSTKSDLALAFKQFQRQNRVRSQLTQTQFYAFAFKGLLNTLDPHSDFAIGERRLRYHNYFANKASPLPFQVTEALLGLKLSDLSDEIAVSIRREDIIVAVNGIDVTNMSAEAGYDLMRKQFQSAPVVFSLLRDGQRQTVSLRLPVARPDKNPRLAATLIDDAQGLYSIRIQSFYAGSADHFHNLLLDLMNPQKQISPLRALILDLRDNPGGTVSDTLAMAGEFIDSGPLMQELGFTFGSSGPVLENEVKYDENPGVTFVGPIVVLVNGQTASSAEIFVRDLQEFHKAVVIGDGDRSTFGKWTLQTVVPHLSSVVRLTTHAYFSPSGLSFQNKGVPVDILWPNLTERSTRSESQYDNTLVVPGENGSMIAPEPDEVKKWSQFTSGLSQLSAQRLADGQPLVHADPALEESARVIGDWLTRERLAQKSAGQRPALAAYQTKTNGVLGGEFFRHWFWAAQSEIQQSAGPYSSSALFGSEP